MREFPLIEADYYYSPNIQLYQRWILQHRIQQRLFQAEAKGSNLSATNEPNTTYVKLTAQVRVKHAEVN